MYVIHGFFVTLALAPSIRDYFFHSIVLFFGSSQPVTHSIFDFGLFDLGFQLIESTIGVFFITLTGCLYIPVLLSLPLPCSLASSGLLFP
jgi:hypothetical protein